MDRRTILELAETEIPVAARQHADAIFEPLMADISPKISPLRMVSMVLPPADNVTSPAISKYILSPLSPAANSSVPCLRVSVLPAALKKACALAES